jgi:gluconolactonase
MSGRLWRLPIAAPGRAGAAECLFEDAGLKMDSLAVQADGRVCIACPGNDLIVRVAADGTDDRIATPPGGPSNICFGGPDLRTAS